MDVESSSLEPEEPEVPEIPVGNGRRRRVVTLCGPDIAKRKGRLWAYGYPDLARLFGLTQTNVRKLVHLGKLDPANLGEVIDYFLRRRPFKRTRKRST
jgi:hypothetical protein